MYRIFKQTGDGEFVHVTTRQEIEQAVQVVEAFDFQWPGAYVVRDLEGNNVYSTELAAAPPGSRRLSADQNKRG